MLPLFPVFILSWGYSNIQIGCGGLYHWLFWFIFDLIFFCSPPRRACLYKDIFLKFYSLFIQLINSFLIGTAKKGPRGQDDGSRTSVTFSREDYLIISTFWDLFGFSAFSS